MSILSRCVLPCAVAVDWSTFEKCVFLMSMISERYSTTSPQLHKPSRSESNAESEWPQMNSHKIYKRPVSLSALPHCFQLPLVRLVRTSSVLARESNRSCRSRSSKNYRQRLHRAHSCLHLPFDFAIYLRERQPCFKFKYHVVTRRSWRRPEKNFVVDVMSVRVAVLGHAGPRSTASSITVLLVALTTRC